MRDVGRAELVLVPAAVVVSSLLGFSGTHWMAGPLLYGIYWDHGFPFTDAIFVACSLVVILFGTRAATSVATRPVGKALPILALAMWASFACTWLLYAATLASLLVFHGGSFGHDVRLSDAFDVTWEWGWPGIVWGGLVPAFAFIASRVRIRNTGAPASSP